jgi:DNA polymerase I-like protein with 3'-5' exonuclease and polymerase domains
MPPTKNATQKSRTPPKPKAPTEPLRYPIGWAIQQEKREKVYRRAVIAPPGYAMLEFDAASQEFRWMAILSGDETMLSLCRPGQDAHTYMGAMIAEVDYQQMRIMVRAGDERADHDRKMGKLANLSLQYRTSAKKLRVKARVDYDIPMEMPQAEYIHSTYHKTYRGVMPYWRDAIVKARLNGYARTLGGSRVQLVGDWSKGSDMKWALESTAINYPIQGTGADQKYLAMSILKDYMIPLGARMLLDLHDGLYWLVPEDKAMKALEEGKWLLDHLPYERAWGFKPPIDLPFDAKIGASWATLKEVKF